MFRNFFKKSRRETPTAISYEDAKTLANDADDAVRAKLAQRTDLPPEILYFLAEDTSADVRREIAGNEAAPTQADMLLVRDQNDQVRGSVALKIARLAPGLSENDQDKLRRMAHEALTLLAKDQAVLVRHVLSDALKELPDAPRDIIRRLAWDVETAVAAPVLRFSPVLTDEDLIEIIKAKPSPGAVGAIAQRAAVSEDVSTEIAATDDIEAIGFLLGNHSAQIREETLDKIIDRAVDIDAWHSPLAARPKLTSKAAAKIARFVADDILGRMAARNDLPSDIMESLRAAVDARLRAVEPDGDDAAAGRMHVDDDTAFDAASALWAKGELDEATVVKTLKDGNDKLAMAMIAVMGDLPMRAVERCCATNSAKGCTALAWKANLSAETAELVQKRLGRIKPSEAILATHDGAYALDDDQLKWQIDFVQGL